MSERISRPQCLRSGTLVQLDGKRDSSTVGRSIGFLGGGAADHLSALKGYGYEQRELIPSCHPSRPQFL